MIFMMCSKRRTLMNYPLLAPGIMQSNYCLEQNPNSIVRSIPSPRMNEKKWKPSLTKIYVQDRYDLLNLPWHYRFSLCERKMADYDLFRTTANSTRSPLRTATLSPLSLTSSTHCPKPSTLPNWMYVGDTIMFRSKKATNSKLPSRLLTVYSNHLLCFLA